MASRVDTPKAPYGNALLAEPHVSFVYYKKGFAGIMEEIDSIQKESHLVDLEGTSDAY